MISRLARPVHRLGEWDYGSGNGSRSGNVHDQRGRRMRLLWAGDEHFLLRISRSSLEFFMTTRIIFNGREYKSPDDMPADVRRLYDQALQQLADADRDGIPDILEQGPEAGNVIGIHHSSFNVNG